jgi:hypothetical protein
MNSIEVPFRVLRFCLLRSYSHFLIPFQTIESCDRIVTNLEQNSDNNDYSCIGILLKEINIGNRIYLAGLSAFVEKIFKLFSNNPP